MSSSIAIPFPSYTALERFCSTNKVSRVAIVKLAFAVVLHRYFDLPNFTSSESLPQNHVEPKSFSTTKTRQVHYITELASTVYLRALLDVKDTDSSAGDDLAPLLVEHQATTVLNSTHFASGPAASLIFTQKVAAPTESLLISLVEHQVRVLICRVTHMSR